MRSLLVIHHPVPASERSDTDARALLPEFILRSYGYKVLLARSEKQALAGIMEADGTVLHLPVAAIKSWSSTLEQQKRVPVLWWCAIMPLLNLSKHVRMMLSLMDFYSPP